MIDDMSIDIQRQLLSCLRERKLTIHFDVSRDGQVQAHHDDSRGQVLARTISTGWGLQGENAVLSGIKKHNHSNR